VIYPNYFGLFPSFLPLKFIRGWIMAIGFQGGPEGTIHIGKNKKGGNHYDYYP